MLQYVSNITKKTTGAHRRAGRLQGESSLWRLDDTTAAGPYTQALDDFGLRLVALAVIRQALLDERSRARNEDVRLRARNFLSGPARMWLAALGIARAGGEQRVYDLIYHGDTQALLLYLDGAEEAGEALDEKDTGLSSYDEREE